MHALYRKHYVEYYAFAFCKSLERYKGRVLVQKLDAGNIQVGNDYCAMLAQNKITARLGLLQVWMLGMNVLHVCSPWAWEQICMDNMKALSCWTNIHEVTPINFPPPFTNTGTLAVSNVLVCLLAMLLQQAVRIGKASSV